LAAVRFLAAGDFPLDLFPANSKVVFGVHVSAIVQSPLFKDASLGVEKQSADFMKMIALTGFDPLHDIDEVLMASPADNAKAPALLVLRGRFNLERIGAGAERYHGIAMVGDSKGGTGGTGNTGGKGNTGVLALLDATTALAGEIPAVRAAIDRHAAGAAEPATPLDAQLAARVQSLRERFDIWGTGENAEGFVPPTGKRQEFDSIDRFEFGVRITQGFELGAEIHAKSPEDAEKLAVSLEELKTMMGAATDPTAPKIDVQVKDGSVKISLAVSPEYLKQAMGGQRGESKPKPGVPVVIGSEPVKEAPQADTGDTRVFTLPGKK
jgi:hypothetical protein